MLLLLLVTLIAFASSGCTAEVHDTPDSKKIEVEVPKVEIKKTPDLDPRTDDVVEVKTPG